jgi:hypothetical protein
MLPSGLKTKQSVNMSIFFYGKNELLVSSTKGREKKVQAP